ncbi:TetR/AcrR family transcriptional regulator [Amycolatopsis sp. cg5]|uniref:TetR/AcrR family transcriptional regulator n=1 Tax=Amycolatopsis sp. cg5 TaxID=3238802 RepID=UPI0035238446
MRADAQRNRDRLVETAARAFADNDPDVTLDAIAKEAGVGIGTLYRHFPTREALVEAAYRSELAKLCDAVPELLENMAPDKAMREWMNRFFDYMATKRVMGDALRAVVASGGNPFSESRGKLTAAISALLRASAGKLRQDVDPGDVLVGMAGISLASAETDQSRRAFDLLMDGLRYGA